MSTFSAAATKADLTAEGAIIGSLHYMAPEQLEGMEADARTDIFAFGAVVHEMIAGKRTFEGRSRVLLMSAIATAEPEPLSKTQPEVPAALEHVVRTCLAKEPADRWQTARDLLAELEWVGQGGSDAGAAVPLAAAKGSLLTLPRVLLGVALALVAAAAVPAARYLRGPSAPGELRFHLPVALTSQPANFVAAVLNMAGSNFEVSPDGRAVVYLARDNVASDVPSLYYRSIGSVAPRRLAGTDQAELPFWSADGRFIGYLAGGKLKKVEASGGPPQDICDAQLDSA